MLSPETDNCPSWISGRERMTVKNISWSISTKEICRPRWGLNPRPPGLQSDGASNWATEAGIRLIVFFYLSMKNMIRLLSEVLLMCSHSICFSQRNQKKISVPFGWKKVPTISKLNHSSFFYLGFMALSRIFHLYRTTVVRNLILSVSSLTHLFNHHYPQGYGGLHSSWLDAFFNQKY